MIFHFLLKIIEDGVLKRDGVLVREKIVSLENSYKLVLKSSNLDVLTSMSTDANNYDIQVDSCDGLSDN